MYTDWLKHIRVWLESYIDGFLDGDERTLTMLGLKKTHSALVASNCRSLAEELGWDAQDVQIAEAVGLLHDVARFPQYSEYGTFQDAVSLDHGEYGYTIVRDSALLDPLPEQYQRAILDSIRHHNARTIPEDIPPVSLPFVKLIRDADKLDIYRIIRESLDSSKLASHLSSALQVSGTEILDPEALEDIRKGQTVNNANISSPGDFMLMQLSWVYDINYRPSFKRIHESRIFHRIGQALPNRPEVREILDIVLADLARNADGKIGV